MVSSCSARSGGWSGIGCCRRRRACIGIFHGGRWSLRERKVVTTTVNNISLLGIFSSIQRGCGGTTTLPRTTSSRPQTLLHWWMMNLSLGIILICSGSVGGPSSSSSSSSVIIVAIRTIHSSLGQEPGQCLLVRNSRCRHPQPLEHLNQFGNTKGFVTCDHLLDSLLLVEFLATSFGARRKRGLGILRAVRIGQRRRKRAEDGIEGKCHPLLAPSPSRELFPRLDQRLFQIVTSPNVGGGCSVGFHFL
mmetsp:Transcript_16125/g.26079  ORF Transcript_16125/g.26079 Transcript_16125/m.26079 type:complete len:248 (+) Transcript_16125:870-1613(+)